MELLLSGYRDLPESIATAGFYSSPGKKQKIPRLQNLIWFHRRGRDNHSSWRGLMLSTAGRPWNSLVCSPGR